MLNRELNKSFSGFNSSIQYNVVNSTDFLYTFVFPAQIQAGWWWLLLFCAIFSLFMINDAVQFGPPPVVCLKTHTSGGCSFVSGLRGCWWYLALKNNWKEKTARKYPLPNSAVGPVPYADILGPFIRGKIRRELSV